jgi:CubicO group peptidase (beta-lactamase class C family)
MKPPKVTKKIAVSNFKTRVTVVLTWILVLGTIYSIYFMVNMFPVIAGFGAKALCSCVYIQGRSEQDVMSQELGTSMGNIGSFSLNREDSSATGKVWFLTSKKAIYRKGLGCTLVNGLEEDELRAQKLVGKTSLALNPDTIAWPNGNLISGAATSGVNQDALRKAVDDAFGENNMAGPVNTRALLVLYDGAIVAEKYADGYNANTPMMGWSMSKSITNALIGILVKQGKIKVEDPAPIETWAGDDRKKITINDLLHSSSGLDWSEVYSRPSDAVDMLFRSKDVGLFAYSKKKHKAPNEVFYYSSGSANILSWIVRQQVGEEGYHRFLYEKLFNKIGMYSALLEPDPSGTYVGSSFGYATARDWARFGLLYLNDGVWNGERILPEGWVKYTTTPADAAPKGEYGALWWLNAGQKGNPSNRLLPNVPTDAFSAQGFEGQYVYVIPSKKLVVVRLGLSQGVLPDMDKTLLGIIESLQKE